MHISMGSTEIRSFWPNLSKTYANVISVIFSKYKVHTRTELCFLDQRTAQEFERISEELTRKASNVKGHETKLEAVSIKILVYRKAI